MGQLREMGGERHKRDSSSVEVLTKGHGRGGASPELPVSDRNHKLLQRATTAGWAQTRHQVSMLGKAVRRLEVSEVVYVGCTGKGQWKEQPQEATMKARQESTNVGAHALNVGCPRFSSKSWLTLSSP